MPDQGLWCVTCQRQTMHRSAGQVNHILHFLVTFFTCGLWGLVWFILSVQAHNSAHICTICGTPYDQFKVPA